MIEVGAKIAGKYRVERVLGRGGMGYVVQAFHEQLSESVAIKFMVPELASDPDAVARFLREARAAFRIRSEHVAQVLDVGEHEGAPFIVMELLSGRDLATEIAERFVPSSEAVGFMLQICEALATAHALGIVHRDLKPSNLFLTRKTDGTPLIKVLDFGISKALDDPNVAPADSLTMSHRLLGSPHYMSPEQARAPKVADARSDIWSLGVVLYELVLGERPFHGDTPVAILASLLSDTVPEISVEQRRKMPEELMAVVLRCLNRDPERRFANAAELARALLPMASPNSEALVLRIEGIARTTPTPALATAPIPTPTPVNDTVESPSPLRYIQAPTLVSGRSSLAGASSTHMLDSRGVPVVQRTFGVKALALVAVLAALFYWFVVRGVRAHYEAGSAAASATGRIQRPSESGPASNDKKPKTQAPPNAMEVAPTFEAPPAPSTLSSAPDNKDRKPDARAQPVRSAAAAASAPKKPGNGGVVLPGPPRPSSTADPKNQPQ